MADPSQPCATAVCCPLVVPTLEAKKVLWWHADEAQGETPVQAPPYYLSHRAGLMHPDFMSLGAVCLVEADPQKNTFCEVRCCAL